MPYVRCDVAVTEVKASQAPRHTQRELKSKKKEVV